MTAERLMLLAAVTAFLLTVYWVRVRDLRERYAIGWIAMAVALLIFGMFPQIIMRLAEACRLSYPAAILFIALATIYTYSFFVSVALSRQHRRNTELAQTVALLQHRLDVLERRANPSD